jgi:hypothetical protein
VLREASRERLGLGERLGNIIALFFILLVFVILIDIQMSDAGFFTTEFGPLEELVFFGAFLYGVFPCLIKLFTGSRNLGRLTDVIGSIIFVLAGTYLLLVYPFDFTALPEYLFGAASEAFSWLSNELVMTLWGLAIVISAISAVYNGILFAGVRRELVKRRNAPEPAPPMGQS